MSDPLAIPEGEICANCKEHKATQMWIGEGGMLAFTHGAFAYWCKCCTLKAQLAYAKECAEGIPEIEKELREVECK